MNREEESFLILILYSGQYRNKIDSMNLGSRNGNRNATLFNIPYEIKKKECYTVVVVCSLLNKEKEWKQ